MTQINPNPFAKDNDRTFKLRLYDIKYSDKKKEDSTASTWSF